MLRPILVLFGALLCGSVAAFFLFVPPLVIAITLAAIVGLFLTCYPLLYCFGPPPELKH